VSSNWNIPVNHADVCNTGDKTPHTATLISLAKSSATSISIFVTNFYFFVGNKKANFYKNVENRPNLEGNQTWQ